METVQGSETEHRHTPHVKSWKHTYNLLFRSLSQVKLILLIRRRLGFAFICGGNGWSKQNSLTPLANEKSPLQWERKHPKRLPRVQHRNHLLRSHVLYDSNLPHGNSRKSFKTLTRWFECFLCFPQAHCKAASQTRRRKASHTINI